ncbi:small VCP/p97-interacting protein-like [Ruditapes philippinarum]|uniref:small VCP/p97-interacting protein-like n=1 Tax=Ruditapes philippinarum TaxID=129788 RepID=UPI00295C2E6B|nr:small VCP/p97-interacting protein-like [Ruditapes philippinarum]
MGSCLAICFKGGGDLDQPSMELRRQQQAEAAERRQRELEGRGVKDPEALKRKQKRQEEMEKAQLTQGNKDSNLKWQVS